MRALLVNENFPFPAIHLLRSRGIDLIAVREIMPGASDQAVLEKAYETGRWLVTFDKDYGELVFSKKAQPPLAIIYLRQEPMPPTTAAVWILDLLAEPELADGYLVVLGQNAIRRRALPKGVL